MTVDELDINDSFRGLMKSLNLDESQFKSYKNSFSNLNFQQLSDIKNDIESQLGLLFTLLKEKYGADMQTSLVSADGYPRSDIDVVSIRLIRVKIIRLRNDHKQLLKSLEEIVIEKLGAKQDSIPYIRESVQPKVNHDYKIPFALVKEIVANSPASSSGLQEGDKIILFDNDIHVRNNDKLKNISVRVMNRIDQTLEVDVFRNDSERLTLKLTPTNGWDGRGLLGCRLVPL